MYDDDFPHPDYTKLRYVLYVRKSTDDASKQTRSLKDQIAECERLARALGIRLVRPYLTEKKSARRANNRPVFTQLLKDLRHGTYDGIVAWAPDRLARNMREGGEIIDMLDEGIIKDLKFVSHSFTNDANGKMLLSIAFALAKRYTDDLSHNVRRGVRHNFSEGKSSGTPKHGYIRNEQGIYEPDGENFALICTAWQMRKAGATYREIAAGMKDAGYGRMIRDKRSRRKGIVIPLDWRRLDHLFSDPFYYGVLLQAGKLIDLREVPGYNFQPAVSEADWNSVQTLASKRRQILKVKDRKPFYPLRKMVDCAVCGQAMYVGASKGNGRRYLYYRCDTLGCSRRPRAMRARKVFASIYAFLVDGLPFTASDYTLYRDKLTILSERKRHRLAVSLHSRQGALKAIRRELHERSLSIVNYSKTSPVWKINNERIRELDARRAELEKDIQRLTHDIQAVEGNALSLEQFLNLAKLAGNKLEAAGPIAKDRICRILFLNLVVDIEKVIDFQMREPFATLFKTKRVLFGAPEATNLEPIEALYDAIAEHWDNACFTDAANLDDVFAPGGAMEYEY